MHPLPAATSPHPFLEGERLFLAPLRRDDAPLYERWLNDPDVRRHISLYSPISHESELTILDRMLTAPAAEAIHLGVWLRENGPRLIGNIGLIEINHLHQFAVLGIVIGDKDEWSRGYGREAIRLMCSYGFDTLNLRKILLTVFGHNTRAIKAYLSLGFHETGRNRAHRLIDGVWQDEIQMEYCNPASSPLVAQARHAAQSAVAWLDGLAVAATVCDVHGVIVYMNDRARQTFAGYGGSALLGASLLDCHPEPARSKLKALLESGGSNTYTIEKKGTRKIIHQSPWFKEGMYAGLVELSFAIPASMPHYLRDSK